MKEGKWICFPGDYAIALAERVQARRWQRDFPIAPFWRLETAWKNVRFFKLFTSTKTQKLRFSAEGRFSVFLKRPYLEVDDWYSYDFTGELELPAGEHYLEVWVYNQSGLPCVKIDGDDLISDESWMVGNNQIDLYPAEVCHCGKMTPNTYVLQTRKIDYVDKFEKDGDVIYDFGKEIYAFARLKGEGLYKLYYGESLNEALNDTSKVKLLAEKPFIESYPEPASEYFCEQIEKFTLEKGGEHRSAVSKAFRYLRVKGGAHELVVEEEYDEQGSVTQFSSPNELLNKIFEVSHYTFSMCAREFYLDGAKRDRWLWGGDAYEAQKAEYYYQYNAQRLKDSITVLFGKSPVKRYVNHIIDYTFHTIAMTWEYYVNSGDKEFLKKILPIMTEHIEFCLTRRYLDGFITTEKRGGVATDWTFVDWGKLPETSGAVSLEQILFWNALKNVEKIYGELGLDGSKYGLVASELKQKINETYWSAEKGAFIFALNEGGVKDETLTCHANAFAILYNFASEEQRKAILKNFKENTIILSKTPFMIEFVLEMLFSTGEFEKGDEMLRSFWGGMVKAGATTFWETYIEGETMETATEMYGRPFGRSYCHIWGAGPLYIIPRFYFGIRAENLGESFVVEPNLSLVKGSSIKVPLKKGTLDVEADGDGKVSVFASELDGRLILNGKSYAIKKGEKLSIK